MLIAWRDYIQDAELRPLDTSTDFDDSAPLSNAQDRRLALVARRSGTGPVQVEAEFAEDKTIEFFALLGHNLPGILTFALTFFDNANNVITFHAESAIWVPPTGSQFPRHSYIVLPQAVSGVRTLRFEATDPSLSFAEPAQFGRMWAGPVWRPSGKTSDRNFNLQTRDDSVVSRSIGSQVYVDYKPRYRQLTCGIPKMTEAEAIGTDDGLTPNLQDIAFQVGRGGEVIVIPTQTSNQAIHKMGVYGIFLDPPTVNFIGANKAGRIFSTDFDVIETL